MTNVIEMHLDKVAELCRRAGARRLEIFGSAVRPDFDAASLDKRIGWGVIETNLSTLLTSLENLLAQP